MKKFKKLFSVMLAVPAITFAADYPSKRVDIIVASKAGGSTDTTARLFSEMAKKHMDDIKFQIVNKPGAGGLNGFELLAREKADGYTIGLTFTPQLVTPITAGRAKYTLDDFTILGNVASDPGVIVVHKDSPFNSIEEMVAGAKEKKLVATVNGIGSDDYLAAKAFQREMGLEFNLVPTKGSTEQKTAILGNHVDVSFMNLSQVLSSHKNGDVKILAVLTEERSNRAPDVKTCKEQGCDVFMTATRGFAIRSDVPEDIKATLQNLIQKTLADEEFIEKAEASYIFLDPMPADEYSNYLKKLKQEVDTVYAETPW